MAYNTKHMLKDADDKYIPQQYDQVNDVFIPLLKMEYYGATVTSRPDITKVPVGAVYQAVDTQEIWQSNGTTWKVI
jgi:hypothetical protein